MMALLARMIASFQQPDLLADAVAEIVRACGHIHLDAKSMNAVRLPRRLLRIGCAQCLILFGTYKSAIRAAFRGGYWKVCVHVFSSSRSGAGAS